MRAHAVRARCLRIFDSSESQRDDVVLIHPVARNAEDLVGTKGHHAAIGDEGSSLLAVESHGRSREREKRTKGEDDR